MSIELGLIILAIVTAGGIGFVYVKMRKMLGMIIHNQFVTARHLEAARIERALNKSLKPGAKLTVIPRRPGGLDAGPEA